MSRILYKYLDIVGAKSMIPEMAKATATAEYEGNMDVVTGNISKFMAERDKQKESEIRAQYLACLLYTSRCV